MRQKSVGYHIALVAITLFLTTPHSVAQNTPAWIPMQIIDVAAMPWEPMWTGLRGTSRGKKLYSNDQGGFMLYLEHDHGWDSPNKARHFHDFHEWGYVLEGNFLICEFITARQTKGSLYNMKAGTWMAVHRRESCKLLLENPTVLLCAFW